MSSKSMKRSFLYSSCCFIIIIVFLVLTISRFSDLAEATNRIVNGIDADADDYPWMVSLRSLLLYQIPGTNQSTVLNHRFCGASLIDTDPICIVTAAHCVDTYYLDSAGNKMYYEENNGTRANYSVIGMFADLGRTNHPSYDINETFITLNITNFSMIHIHDNWDTETNDKYYDIALMVINDDQQLPDNYPIAHIAELNEHKNYKNFEMIGWGDIEDGGSSANRLQHTVLYYVNDTHCNYVIANYFLAAVIPPEALENIYQNYSQIYPEIQNMSSNSTEFVLFVLDQMNLNVDDSQICADGNNTSVCQGDSGGPIFVNNNETNESILIGIASYEIGGCNTQDPFSVSDVFTDAAFYKQWIQDIKESVIGPVETTTPSPTDDVSITTSEIEDSDSDSFDSSEISKSSDSSEISKKKKRKQMSSKSSDSSSSESKSESSSNDDAQTNEDVYEIDNLEAHNNDKIVYTEIIIGSCIGGVCLLVILCLVLYLKCNVDCNFKRGKNGHIAIDELNDDDVEEFENDGNETEMMNMITVN